MAGGGGGGADQRSMADSSAGSDVAPIPVPHRGLSFRQRKRVHQPYGSEAAEQAAGGADQIAATALQRQRPGGSQERSRDSEAHGLWLYLIRSRRNHRGVL